MKSLTRISQISRIIRCKQRTFPARDHGKIVLKEENSEGVKKIREIREIRVPLNTKHCAALIEVTLVFTF